MFGELDFIEMARDLLTIHQNISLHLKNPTKTKVGDFDLETFVQVWGNTSGGFEGVGGSAMTSQRTYVLIPMYADNEDCLVFFGGRFAYNAPYSNTFIDDVRSRCMAGMSKKEKYLKGTY